MPDNNEKEVVRCSFCGKPEYICQMKQSYINAMMQYWQTEYGGAL